MQSVKRRTFLKAALAATAVPTIQRAGTPPSRKLNVACVGVGRMGSADAYTIAQLENVVALCDVDQAWHKKHVARFDCLKGIKLWTDYRVMFDRIGKDIDAVHIATPEHAHFAISMYFIKRGKHVYCQKPLCHTVNEVRRLTEESTKHQVVTQMGHQGHSSSSSANIRDWALAGSIGEIREVIAYSRKNYWTDKPPAEPTDPPPTLDWNLYLNRAEMIPFSTSYMNREWIRYSHFSGAVGDMGAHILDGGYYALDLRARGSSAPAATNRPSP